jgi:hypothetical protein
MQEALASFASPRGVFAPSSTWLITARAWGRRNQDNESNRETNETSATGSTGLAI